jgi:hypothetical protein
LILPERGLPICVSCGTTFFASLYSVKIRLHHPNLPKSFLAWAGEDFDPERFDRHAANATLLRMAWNQWGDK